MLEANVLDKVSPGNRGRHFLGPVYVDWPMLQSNSPESRDFIRLEVGPSLVCLAIGKIYERSSVSAESIRYFCKVKLTYGRERAP